MEGEGGRREEVRLVASKNKARQLVCCAVLCCAALCCAVRVCCDVMWRVVCVCEEACGVCLCVRGGGGEEKRCVVSKNKNPT